VALKNTLASVVLAAFTALSLPDAAEGRESSNAAVSDLADGIIDLTTYFTDIGNGECLVVERGVEGNFVPQ
jgi:hypothetical protein